LAGVFNHANWLVTQLLLAVVSWSASVPGGHFYIGSPELARRDGIITVFELRDGMAVLIQSGGQNWLVDCGSAFDAERIIVPALHSFGIDQLEGILLTHPDINHIGGVKVLRERFLVKWVKGSASLAKKDGIEGLKAGDRMILGKSRLEVVFPPEHWVRRNGDDAAMVVRCTFGKTNVLILSDAGFLTEMALLENKTDVSAAILIRDSHGRDFGGTGAFKRAVGAMVEIDPVRLKALGAIRISFEKDVLHLQNWGVEDPSWKVINRSKSAL